MKNIHLLPTPKPSRLLKDLVDKTYQFKKEVLYGNRFEVPLIIYITSDEEIKEGDHILIHGHYKHGKHVTKVIKITDTYEVIEGGNHSKKVCQKIILTTDADLIKDGVQAIDDEFLKWFVKNPSCEFVKIYYKCDKTGCYLKEWNTCCKEAKPILTLFAENESKAKYFREQENN